MIPVAVSIHAYQGSLMEKEEFRKLSAHWLVNGDFWEVPAIEESLQISGTHLWYAVAEGSSEWVGMLLARSSFGEHDLFYVYVRDDFRRHGVGRQLMALWLSELRLVEQKGRLFLEVRPSNTGAIRLYEAFGFKEAQRRPRYYADGEDAVIMCLDIQ